MRRQTADFAINTTSATTTFTYDDASRLKTVNQGNHTFTYGYSVNSNLVESLTTYNGTQDIVTTLKTYDFLNRMTDTTSTVNGTAVSQYAYAYNNANQIVRTTHANGEYWQYEYDNLGQVISGIKYWSDDTPVNGQNLQYGFDDIGNRTHANTNGQVGNYTSNEVNQYLNREVPNALDIIGCADQDATVTINNQSVDRTGEYFHKSINVDNTSSSVYFNANIVAVKNFAGANGEDLVATKSGKLFVPQSPEVLTYDNDGNLLSDGRWLYTWNGENRLIQIETHPNGENRLIQIETHPNVETMVSRIKLNFTYDFQGRRVVKKTYMWNSATLQYDISKDINFVYDGWNISAELDGLNNNAVINTYVWGLDVSGSIKGAGGVGGLLALTNTTGTYYYIYDNNGNVVALVESLNGNVVNQYDYGPFGEHIMSNAEVKNPFKLSTKYCDIETKLYYYGYRYYSVGLGRWINRDPINELGGSNLYRFTNNDAINFIDFYGKYWRLGDAIFHFYEGHERSVTLNEIGLYDTVWNNVKQQTDSMKSRVETIVFNVIKNMSCESNRTLGGSLSVPGYSGIWWVGGVTVALNYICNIKVNCMDNAKNIKCSKSIIYKYDCTLTYEIVRGKNLIASSNFNKLSFKPELIVWV